MIKKYFLLILVIFCCHQEAVLSQDWEIVYSKGGYFLDAHCTDSKNCLGLADASRPKLLRTTNGGDSWEQVLTDSVLYFYPKYREGLILPKCFSYPNTKLCIIGCDTGRFLRTTDNGNTWERIFTECKENIREISMADENIGFAVTFHYLLRTINGGKVWDILDLPKRFPLRVNWHISFPAPELFVFEIEYFDQYSTKIAIIKTRDTGMTWQEYIYPHGGTGQVFFSDTLHGWITPYTHDSVNPNAEREIIFSTTDGGNTWNKQFDSIFYGVLGFKDIVFFENDVGLACGRGNFTIFTNNGGNTWNRFFTLDSNQYFLNFNCAEFLNKRKILLFTDNGLIIRGSIEPSIIPVFSSDNDSFSIFPNPSYSGHEITLQIPDNISGIKISFYNSLGSLIDTHIESDVSPGQRTINYKPGVELSSGTYWLRVETGKESWCKPFLIIKN